MRASRTTHPKYGDIDVAAEAHDELQSRAEASHGNEPVLTVNEAEMIVALKTEEAQLQRDIEILGKAINRQRQIAQTDPGKAAANAADINSARQELESRWSEFTQSALAVNAQLSAKQLEGERAKLGEALPDGVDDLALRGYLTGTLGFRDDDIDAVADHRLVTMAEKARRYDELTGGEAKPKKVPVFRKGKPETQTVTTTPEYREARQQAERTNPIDDWAKVYGRRPEKQTQQQKSKSVSSLRKQLRSSGSMDDAHALLQAKREMRT